MEKRTDSPYPRIDRPWLAVVGVLIVISTVLFARNDREHEWRWYQYEFKQLVADQLGADKAKVVNDAIGALRVKIGHSEFGKAHKLLQGEWEPLWVVDFPMFEHDDEAQRWNAVHHPFTSPKDGHEDWLETDPGRCLAKAYDVVLNGIELGGGSIRIHDRAMQQKVFSALNIGEEEARVKFGFLLDALRFGAPPHGGIAFGLDRLAMLFSGAKSLRDVIAFPKTQKATCLMTEAPSGVDVKQLRELSIRVTAPEKK